MKVQLFLHPIDINWELISVVSWYTHSWHRMDNIIRENIYEIEKKDKEEFDELLKHKPVLCDKKDATFVSGTLYLKAMQESSN